MIFGCSRKRFLVVCIFFECLMLSGAACPAFAGNLSIRIRAALVAENRLVKGTVEIANQGSEDALRLRMEILFPSGSVTFPELPRLNADESKTFSIEHPLGSIKHGTYPLPILVTFHDVNLYPFSALSCPTFSVGKESSGGIRYSSRPFTVGKEGTAVIDLENPESRSKVLTATLILPREFACPEKERKIFLGAFQRQSVPFNIVNRHALPEAAYPMFCLLQYDEEDLHHTGVCRMMTRVREGRNWFYRTRWVWFAVGGALVVLLMVVRGRLDAGS